MSASVSDVASATSILVGVCVVVLLTLTAICRLLRRGTSLDDRHLHLRRCPDGTGCAAAAGPDDRCPTAQVPEDRSTVTVSDDRPCSST